MNGMRTAAKGRPIREILTSLGRNALVAGSGRSRHARPVCERVVPFFLVGHRHLHRGLADGVRLNFVSATRCTVRAPSCASSARIMARLTYCGSPSSLRLTAAPHAAREPPHDRRCSQTRPCHAGITRGQGSTAMPQPSRSDSEWLLPYYGRGGLSNDGKFVGYS